MLVLIVAWQLYVSSLQPRPDIVPGPLDVLGPIGTRWESGQPAGGRLDHAAARRRRLPHHRRRSPRRSGSCWPRWQPLRRAFGPLISGLQVLPSVAWVPAAILWFGLTDATVYFVVLMGAIPSIINGLISGVDQMPPQLPQRGHGAGRGRLAARPLIILPAALPGYLAGLKQGWAFSWRSLMAAEIIAVGGTIGFGLGSMLDQGRELADMTSVLATILLILAVGILIELVFFAPLERRMLRRRGLLQGGTR